MSNGEVWTDKNGFDHMSETVQTDKRPKVHSKFLKGYSSI